MKRIILISSLWLYALFTYGQQNTIKLVDSLSGQPIAQASLNVLNNGLSWQSNNEGLITLAIKNGNYTVNIKHLSYQSKELNIRLPFTELMVIRLATHSQQLEEVRIETGYQSLPKERATGAFEVLDKKLLDLQVSTNILDRLRNNVPGLAFNRAGIYAGRLNISVRGQSTISANTDPLIVLDNFAYEGDITSINPDDIASITFLKDAAAASIWGARAGNGVIVITTIKGRYNQKTKINFNSSLDLAEKPNVFFGNRMSTAAYVDIQTFLFNRNYYNSLEQNDIKNISHVALPQVAEILIAKRDGKISATEAESQLNQLKALDVRQDMERYLLQTGLNQKYTLSIQGGTAQQKYYIGGGYDDNRSNEIGNSLKRFSLQASQSWAFLKDKLQLNTQLFYVKRQQQNNALNYTIADPYARLADAQGNALAVPTLRTNFIDKAIQQGLLDWYHKPLENQPLLDNTSTNNDLRLNVGLDYKIGYGLSASFLYQYVQFNNQNRNYNAPESFYTRNLINSYTQRNTDGSLTLPIPLGGIIDLDQSNTNSHALRSQLSYDYNSGKHNIHALSGYEVRKTDVLNRGYRLYGYDDEHALSSVVDQVSTFQNFSTAASKTKIDNRDANVERADRFISYYFNGAYTYANKYTFSTSARLDQSNLFGVNTNQKGVPLYSVGASWLASAEPFMQFKAIDLLKLRLTFGYNGNIDRSISAYTTANYSNAKNNAYNAFTQQLYANIQNPPNPELRWERVKMLNLGVDFSILKQRISGSVDIYTKKGIDLIGNMPFAPSSGIAVFKGNYASTESKGIDARLKTIQLSGDFKWETNWLYAHISDKVTAYQTKGTVNNYLTGSGLPLAGRPLFSIYSYEWAGLEPNTGHPMGYLNGVPSTDYVKILAAYTPDNLIYYGSARPTHFGAVRNTFSYKQLSLSFNISYKWNYYFRRASTTYGATFGLETSHSDYELRWQKPGDEQNTQVPSVPSANNANRDNLYTYSSLLIEKGNHIRFEDINLGYTFSRLTLKKMNINSLTVFGYANNIGLLYKAAKTVKDPEYDRSLYGISRTIAFGLRLGL